MSDHPHSVWLGMRRGLSGRCPNCGEGRLFRKYLKVQSPCPACGHDNARYPADDAPAYFTILLVGHLVIGPLLLFNFISVWPVHWVLLSTLPALAILSLIVLPLAKGAIIGLQWALKDHNSRDDDVLNHGRL
ncbi:MAG: DUF983 domain-containing protein [Caulobacteraceae bacterium]|nr:MAG: DUF983 domain-containing protein [Caulobacteraceae bacterium]